MGSGRPREARYAFTPAGILEERTIAGGAISVDFLAAAADPGFLLAINVKGFNTQDLESSRWRSAAVDIPIGRVVLRGHIFLGQE